jgi:hypothetical protein
LAAGRFMSIINIHRTGIAYSNNTIYLTLVKGERGESIETFDFVALKNDDRPKEKLMTALKMRRSDIGDLVLRKYTLDADGGINKKLCRDEIDSLFATSRFIDRVLHAFGYDDHSYG